MKVRRKKDVRPLPTGGTTVALPNELVEHILKFVACDLVLDNYDGLGGRHSRRLYHPKERKAKESLIDVSTVCRTWWQLALPYIFHTIALYFDPLLVENLYEEQHFEDDHETHCDCKRYRSLQVFLTFIEESPQIASRIKELRLFQVDHKRHQAPLLYEAPCDIFQLVSVLRSLPKLRAVHLQDVSLEQFQKTEPYTPQELERLGPPMSFDRFYFGHTEQELIISFTAILPLISVLGDIQELHLKGVYVHKENEDSDKRLPSHFKVGALNVVHYDGIGGALSVFSDPSFIREGPLRSIDLYELLPKDLSVVQDMLTQAGPTLTKVTLFINRLLDPCWKFAEMANPNQGVLPSISSLDLSPCINLNSLTLKWEPCLRKHRGPVFSRVAPVLSRLHSHSALQTITFILYYSGTLHDLSERLVGAKEVDRALAQIPSLRRVVFDIEYAKKKQQKDALVDVGTLLFPECKAKGLL
ncbi:hypothetical protein NM688_g5906 [Phlebia brevispora]|uniref:Uncharacterized protein n=1 Tax=Phlebia brevispora TaxID=194682 RepID=A0ACC1SN96_9APHY|nr:hypothetical protein NM688_g5906 [Phlebia brevispora]